MNVLFFCTRWGSDAIGLKKFVEKALAAGYDGIEAGVPSDLPAAELEELFSEAGRHHLRVILQHYDTYEADFEEHKRRYAAWFEKIKPYRPFLINSQTGKDFFSMQQNLEIIAIADGFSARYNIPVVHETHRNKFSFACHITHAYLQAEPSLRLALDISHWVNVAESFLDDQPQAVSMALERAAHIHARVGFPEGPQVPDPRDPRWAEAVETHCRWWDRIVEQTHRHDTGATVTFTPEFGPYPYLINTPFTDEPIANQWDINVHMMQLLRSRYQPYISGIPANISA